MSASFAFRDMHLQLLLSWKIYFQLFHFIPFRQIFMNAMKNFLSRSATTPTNHNKKAKNVNICVIAIMEEMKIIISCIFFIPPRVSRKNVSFVGLVSDDDDWTIGERCSLH